MLLVEARTRKLASRAALLFPTTQKYKTYNVGHFNRGKKRGDVCHKPPHLDPISLGLSVSGALGLLRPPRTAEPPILRSGTGGLLGHY